MVDAWHRPENLCCILHGPRAGPPPIGGDFYNCWTGDPHFVCRFLSETRLASDPHDWEEDGNEAISEPVGTTGMAIRFRDT